MDSEKIYFVVDASQRILQGRWETLKSFPGYQVCWATHPMQKNFSRNARGRCLHYRQAGQKLTLCNMRFAGGADKMTKENGACSGKVCQVCVPKMKRLYGTAQDGRKGSEDRANRITCQIL